MIDPIIRLISIVGPTASGKTELAIGLAKRFGGEIVCADSRTVYKGMDIGTAKPTTEERSRIPHHLLDVVDPNQVLTAAEFKSLAETAITEIADRGSVPFLVGGSGLYTDSVLYDYRFPPAAPELRQELDRLDDDELLRRLETVDPEAVANTDLANRRRVIRAIETAGQPRRKSDHIRPNTLVLGLDLNKETTQKRIEDRVEMMLSQGFFEEVKKIGEEYGWDCPALSAIGYRAFRQAVTGNKTMAEAAQDFVRGDVLLAKKQRTWFRRNREIHWLGDSPADEADRLVAEFLTAERV